MADPRWRGRPRSPGGPATTRIFSEGEKRSLLVGHLFAGADLDGVDFSGADLRLATFENTSLRECDFSVTHLAGAQFLDCNLRGARFGGARFGSNRFDGSSFVGTRGLTLTQRTYVEERGGSFLRVIIGRSPATDPSSIDARSSEAFSRHVLLFHDDHTQGEWVRVRLHDAGFAVTRAATFLEAAQVLAADPVDVFLIYLPEMEWVRNAILREVRRANPALAIVGLTASLPDAVGEALGCLHSATLLPVSTNWNAIVARLRTTIAGSKASGDGAGPTSED